LALFHISWQAAAAVAHLQVMVPLVQEFQAKPMAKQEHLV
jgi:hypothetical protein